MLFGVNSIEWRSTQDNDINKSKTDNSFKCFIILYLRFKVSFNVLSIRPQMDLPAKSVAALK